ncbi:MAG: hypothetical protein EOP88_00115 [Verrucomicrobiaceae bacterium]|nr:MAG: hypothetical protein EOP88_00115 [Verrucomicrobiaceae bacterium]
MNELTSFLLENPSLAALVALKPKSYIIRLLIAGGAFAGAMNGEKVVARVIGFVWLLIAGAGFLIVGGREGTFIDILLGLVLGGAALCSWWYTRS